MRPLISLALGACLTLVVSGECAAAEDIEFVAEHLPEVAMDDRYATLPVRSGGETASPETVYQLQSAYMSATSGSLEISGPLLAASAQRRLNDEWQIGAFAFYDPLQLQSGLEHRPLQTLFAPANPIERPVDATFEGLDGTVDDYGVGFFVARAHDGHGLSRFRWSAGALWQRVVLQDYSFDYQVVDGPQAGTSGSIDFDASYQHVVPFLGIEWPGEHGAWATSAHALLAWPIPRRGVEGHISGPGFDIEGDSAEAGAGKHFGDPSLTLGYTFTYRPMGLSIDVGTLLLQSLLEPRIHQGIEQNLVLSFSVSLHSGD